MVIVTVHYLQSDYVRHNLLSTCNLQNASEFADSDMQGTEGALGGPDVRRRIPIKLLPKQARSMGFHILLIDLHRSLLLFTQCN